MNAYSFFRMAMNSGTVLGYFWQALPITCAVGIAFFTVRLVLFKKRKRQIPWTKLIVQAIFSCYLTGLISLVVLPANFWLHFYDGIFLGRWDEMGKIFQLGEVNLVPSLIKCLTGELSLGSWVKTMLIGNIAMFVPFGFLFPLATRFRNTKQILWTAVVFPIGLEVLQLVFGRSFDVDDVLCNFIGILIGAMLACALLKAKSFGVPKDG